jgi:hypothetical protein
MDVLPQALMNALRHGAAMAFSLAALATCAAAAEGPGAESQHFAIAHRAIDAGGGLSASARFEITASIDPITVTTIPTSPTFVNRSGFIGQLNEAPALAPDHFVARPGRPLKALKSTLLQNDSDAEGASLQFVSIPATSVNGVPLSIVGDWVLYDAGPNNRAADSFTYVVTDGIDESIGIVTLANSEIDGLTFNIALTAQGSDNTLRIFGIPGHNYQVQYTESLAAPIAWTNLGSPAAAPANGLIQRTDTAAPATRFYRAIEP